ncbi:MAG: exo-alpha-sialidase [Bryobacterales bacterium]|nr:exo-alpha-sialidase [Bryobacterales bacterium]
MTRLPDGRLAATFQINAPAKSMPGTKEDEWGAWLGRVFVSDDRGGSWKQTGEFPMRGARPIAAGGRLYVVGHASGVVVMRSDDGGQTWSRPVRVAAAEEWGWYSQACSVVHARGRVYFTMDRVTTKEGRPSRGVYAPVVMSAKEDDDWLRADAWTFSNVLTYDAAVKELGAANLIGVPFYPPDTHMDERKLGRWAQFPGWFESNVVQVHDPEHIWHDAEGRTLHILMRGHTVGAPNMMAVAKAVHRQDGSIVVSVERTPAGTPVIFIPCPGGHNRFHVTWDERTGLYWLVSLQVTDSMKKVKLLNPKRWNLPYDERHRLALHFSKNCVDWCFAGLIANARDDGQSRHYGPGVIDGEDLAVLSRTATEKAKNAHDGDLITFHRVKSFRDLVY